MFHGVITEFSLIWQGRYKLITNAGASGWYPPALGFNDTHDPQNVDPLEWPCVGPTTQFIWPTGACAVCSEDHPCLFDILKDEGERLNIAAKNPDIVKRLSAQMKTYLPYVEKHGKPHAGMSVTELNKYECLTTEAAFSAPFPNATFRGWWGEFFGPCCRPKAISTTPISHNHDASAMQMLDAGS